MPRKGPNKMKFWRKNAIKGYGRRLRNAMNGMNHPAGLTPFLAALMKRAGIETKAWDNRFTVPTKKAEEVSTADEVPPVSATAGA